MPGVIQTTGNSSSTTQCDQTRLVESIHSNSKHSKLESSNSTTKCSKQTSLESNNKTHQTELDLNHKNAKQEEQEEDVRYGLRSACAQITASIGQNFLLFSLGMILGMPTIVVGVLDNKTASNQTRLESPELILTDDEASWFGSMLLLFHPFGSVASGCFLEYIGRKRIMLAVNIPFFVGWLMLYFAQTKAMLMWGSITMSLGIGCCEAPVISYIGEICEPRIRGSLSLLAGSAVSFGYLVGFVLFALTDWRTTFLLSAIFPVITLATVSSIPESPAWLVSKGKLTKAEKSLRWLRGWSEKDKVRIEFDRLVKHTNDTTTITIFSSNSGTSVLNERSKQSQPRSTSELTQFVERLRYLRRPEIVRPFNMILILFLITNIASFQPMRPFLVEIFSTFGLPMKPEWILVLTGLLNIVGSIASVATVNKFGKRGLSLWSTALNFLVSMLLGVCAINFDWPSEIPLVLMCTSFWLSGYGMVPLPWMLLSEVYPLQVRGIASGISAASCYVIQFITTKTYINFNAWFGLHGTIFIYAFVGLAGFVYIYFYVPETEDKTLQEIMHYFLYNKKVHKKSVDLRKNEDNTSGER